MTCFVLPYKFQRGQLALFKVVACDKCKSREQILQRESDDDPFIIVANCIIEVDSIIRSKNMSVTTIFQYGEVEGQLLLVAEELKEVNLEYSFVVEGQHLDKKNTFGKSDPFLVISRFRQSGRYIPVWRSPVMFKTLHAQWSPFSVSMRQLCNADVRRPLLWEVYDWEKNSKHQLIGCTRACLEDILNGMKDQDEFRIPLINPNLKSQSKKYTNSGELVFKSVTSRQLFSFVDYLAAGLNLTTSMIVDMSASNGHAGNISSLHYFNPYMENSYVIAMKQLLAWIPQWDSDGTLALFGMAARVPPMYNFAQLFPLNFSWRLPYVNTDAVLDVYAAALCSLEPWTPSLLLPVLQSLMTFPVDAASPSSSSANSRITQYTTVWILTDGELQDLQSDDVKHALLQSAEEPVSLCFVVIGSAPAADLFKLCEDASLPNWMDSTGAAAVRNHVNITRAAELGTTLTRILNDVPMQALEYFKWKNIDPIHLVGEVQSQSTADITATPENDWIL